VIQQEPQRLQQLRQNITDFKDLLKQHRLKTLPHPDDLISPICCFLLQDATQVIQAGNALKSKGLLTSAIRPPTVNISRIRISLMATHQPEQLQYLVEGLTQVCNS
jgi:8-amino-7-oxononanoate synthase